MAVVVAQKLPQSRSDRSMFSSSDDNAMMKRILETHSPDGREIDAKPLLHIIGDIFKRAAPGILQGTQAQVEALDEKAFHSGLVEMLELLSYTISRISCEISCKCSGGGDAHATTVAICNTLSSYSWDAKVVIALAAFAVNYGEFWLVAQLYSTNPLAKGLAILKKLPEILEYADALKPKFEALTNLIKAMLDVTKCIVELKELPSQYITPDSPLLVTTTTAHIPIAVYWTTRSIVACTSQIMGLIGKGHEYIASTTETWELSRLAHKVNTIHSHLMKQLNLCNQHIDEKSNAEAFLTLVRLLETSHLDNMKILKALINAKDDQLPLVDGSTKKRISIDVLRRKNVLLFISDLELSREELSIIEQMFADARQQPSRAESQYEVVWLPVVDRPWNETKKKEFEVIQTQMPWFSVHDPSQLDPAVIRYIKEVWRFNKKALLVVLDPQGRVVNPNAMHMIWIWGSLAFPFTSAKEESLWKDERWRIELLADSIEPLLFNWIADGKYICLYGGEDMEWVRKFTLALRKVAQAAKIPLEMLYVGKSNPREKVRKNNEAIVQDGLSHVLQDTTLIWFFWVRIESMWHSKVQHGMSLESDTIMQEIMTILSFDESVQGWAVISKGSAEIVRAKGDTILTALNEYDAWKEMVEDRGFVPALNQHLQDQLPLHRRNHLILPATTRSIPERVVCAECGLPIKKLLRYRCDTD